MPKRVEKIRAAVEEDIRRVWSALEENPFLKFVRSQGESADDFAGCPEAFETVQRWRHEVSPGEGSYYSTEEKTAIETFLCNSPFLDAILISVLADYYSEELNGLLSAAHSSQGVPNRIASHVDLRTRASQILGACRKILEGYQTLRQMGLYPGQHNVQGEEANMYLDVLAIVRLFSEDEAVLRKETVTHFVLGHATELASTKRGRYQDHARYLLWHLREILPALLNTKATHLGPILVPIARRLGALNEEHIGDDATSHYGSLERQLKNLKDRKTLSSAVKEHYARLAKDTSLLKGPDSILSNFLTHFGGTPTPRSR